MRKFIETSTEDDDYCLLYAAILCFIYVDGKFYRIYTYYLQSVI